MKNSLSKAKSWLKVILISITNMAFAECALADSIPQFDVNAACHQEANNIGKNYPDKIDFNFKECVHTEQENYEKLKEIWDQGPKEAQIFCIEQAEKIGVPNYYLEAYGCYEANVKSYKRQQQEEQQLKNQPDFHY